MSAEEATINDLVELCAKVLEGNGTEDDSKIVASAVMTLLYSLAQYEAQLDKAEKDIAEWKRMYNSALSLPFSGDFDE